MPTDTTRVAIKQTVNPNVERPEVRFAQVRPQESPFALALEGVGQAAHAITVRNRNAEPAERTTDLYLAAQEQYAAFMDSYLAQDQMQINPRGYRDAQAQAARQATKFLSDAQASAKELSGVMTQLRPFMDTYNNRVAYERDPVTQERRIVVDGDVILSPMDKEEQLLNARAEAESVLGRAQASQLISYITGEADIPQGAGPLDPAFFRQQALATLMQASSLAQEHEVRLKQIEMRNSIFSAETLATDQRIKIRQLNAQAELPAMTQNFASQGAMRADAELRTVMQQYGVSDFRELPAEVVERTITSAFEAQAADFASVAQDIGNKDYFMDIARNQGKALASLRTIQTEEMRNKYQAGLVNAALDRAKATMLSNLDPHVALMLRDPNNAKAMLECAVAVEAFERTGYPTNLIGLAAYTQVTGNNNNTFEGLLTRANSVGVEERSTAVRGAYMHVVETMASLTSKGQAPTNTPEGAYRMIQQLMASKGTVDYLTDPSVPAAEREAFRKALLDGRTKLMRLPSFQEGTADFYKRSIPVNEDLYFNPITK